MSQLFDYVFDIEAAPDDDRVATGLCAVFVNVRGTATCGVTTQGDTPCDGPVPGEEDQDGHAPGDGGCTGIVFPGLTAAGTGTVTTAAEVFLPGLDCQARQAGWLPGAGSLAMPRLVVAALGRVLVLSRSVLPPLFGLARAAGQAMAALPACAALGATGALGQAVLPGSLAVLAASGLARRGDALAVLPALVAEGHCCGLANPVVRRTPKASVVGLLNRDSPVLAALAATLVRGLDDPDDKAAALLYAISNLLDYVADPASLDYGDVWSCSLATWFRGRGDCEDGAILLHGLLLACGAAEDRLVTLFGRVGPDDMGHAWTCYKRMADERWTVLDWTTGPRSPLSGPEDFPTIAQSPDYHHVEYALTGSGFRQARTPVADFFPAARADALALPPPACAGAANLAARGMARLGAAPGHPLSCLGRTGASGAGTCPGPKARGQAGWRAAQAMLPGAAGLGRTGCLAALRLPVPELTARRAARCLGRCAVAALAGGGAATSAVRCGGRCRAAGFRLRGAGHAGPLCRGMVLLPDAAAGLAGCAGTLGDGRAGLAAPVTAALAWFEIRGTGAVPLGPPRVQARGVANAAACDGRTLEHDDGEVWP